MEPYVPQGEEEEPGAPPEQIDRRVPDRHVVTLAKSPLRTSSGDPVHGNLVVRPDDQILWLIEVPAGSTVGLGLRLPAGAPVRTFGPFAVLAVSVVDLDGAGRQVEILADAGDFAGPSLSFDFAIKVVERAETPAPPPPEQTMALTGEDPVDPGTELKIDKMSKPPDLDPRGRWKRFPVFGEGRWQKILVDVDATPAVSLWLDPEPPSGSSNP